MLTPPLRTITFGIAEPHPISWETLQRAQECLNLARNRYQDAGYEVQTVRLSTRSIFENPTDHVASTQLAYVRTLQQQLEDLGIEYCSLGPAIAAHPKFSLGCLDALVDILCTAQSCSASVLIATVEHGLRQDAVIPTAHIIQRLALESKLGDGNFRFAMLACVPPGSPFFPAAYHHGTASLSLGVQGASLLTEALLPHAAELAMGLKPGPVTQWVRDVLNECLAPIVEIGQQIATERRLRFGGIDLSPAPMGDDSIVTALELCAGGSLGAMGTLAAAAALTNALKSTSLPTCGYCGLMLPVLEDALLGKRWEEGVVDVHHLLLYSAVCGTGLDTIPIAGDCATEEIAHLLLDVALLALRLQKPLSARLFPVPGKQAGEWTEFVSPYLTNTRIQPL